ncbi:MAG: hypothetical protein LBT04_00245 [Prevotellaceae bacterium]|nr:hypothetical protein [Prevotellaceae bacterium]
MERKLVYKETYSSKGSDYEIMIFIKNEGTYSVQSFFNGMPANAFCYSISPSEATGKFNWQANKDFIFKKLVKIVKSDIDDGFGIIS